MKERKILLYSGIVIGIIIIVLGSIWIIIKVISKSNTVVILSIIF